MPTAAQFRQAAQIARQARDESDAGADRVRRARQQHGVIGEGGLAVRIREGLDNDLREATELGDRLAELATELEWRAQQCDAYAAALSHARSSRAAAIDAEQRAAMNEERPPNLHVGPADPAKPHVWIDV